ncbi:hypothetical protein B0H19DRAFT_1264562 [Mycena capillaripes]|nr:hypothetical protein B0H19DRAFT_1264562 [Mycena capillaripes]
MALKQYPLDKTFLVAAWLESLCFGCFLVVFLISVYIHLEFRKGQRTHNRVMFVFSVVMFVLATIHLGKYPRMNIFRLIRGYVDFRLVPGGPVGYLGTLKSWDHIFKDTVYGVQSMIADTAAVYRCWILYNRDYRIIIFPSILLVVGTVSGYIVCGLYTTEDPNATVFDPRLINWITTFWSVGVAQNIITTGLMSWRLWQWERSRLGSNPLRPILRILVESAALNLFVQILLLAFYSVNYNVQYIILECITPIFGFTFSIMTIRINLRSQRKAANALSAFADTGRSVGPTQTSGSELPMIVIARRVEQVDDFDGLYSQGTKFEDEP